ncbi:MAG TPA: flagellar hook-length control protein FliK [Acidimicrobiales bacterium]|nr:flagellar hook-length control protein FliK [Acidimicrobiales bacterium]
MGALRATPPAAAAAAQRELERPGAHAPHPAGAGHFAAVLDGAVPAPRRRSERAGTSEEAGLLVALAVAGDAGAAASRASVGAAVEPDRPTTDGARPPRASELDLRRLTGDAGAAATPAPGEPTAKHADGAPTESPARPGGGPAAPPSGGRAAPSGRTPLEPAWHEPRPPTASAAAARGASPQPPGVPARAHPLAPAPSQRTPLPAHPARNAATPARPTTARDAPGVRAGRAPGTPSERHRAGAPAWRLPGVPPPAPARTDPPDAAAPRRAPSGEARSAGPAGPLLGALSKARPGANGTFSITASLDPPELGRIEATVTVQGERVEIALAPVSDAGHAALAGALGALRSHLESQGFAVASLSLAEPRALAGRRDRQREAPVGARRDPQRPGDASDRPHVLDLVL